MYLEKINRTELKILDLVLYNGITEKMIASKLERSPSWISECVTHLSMIGFVDLIRNGISKEVIISDNDLGTGIRKLMIDEPMLSLDVVLPDSGLLILPLMLSTGTSVREISRRTHLTTRTVYNKIRKWKGMGLIDLKAYPDRVNFNRSKYNLIEFIEIFSRYRNRRYLKDEVRDGVIIWEGRDEFLFTSGMDVDQDIFRTAGPSRAEELGCNIISRSDYYYFSPIGNEISLEEALVQTARVDRINPRPYRLMREHVKKGEADKEKIFYYARKYEILDRIEEMM
ncbi:MAG: hypothetical protein KAH57_07080 [Thermoplasmata archaeon]|nr:hypothetical protein [Thermoplasmata archaeon]